MTPNAKRPKAFSILVQIVGSATGLTVDASWDVYGTFSILVQIVGSATRSIVTLPRGAQKTFSILVQIVGSATRSVSIRLRRGVF